MRMDLQDETGLIGCPSWIHIEPCVSLPTRHLGACWKRFEQALNLGPLFRRHNKQYEATTDRQRRGAFPVWQLIQRHRGFSRLGP